MEAVAHYAEEALNPPAKLQRLGDDQRGTKAALTYLPNLLT